MARRFDENILRKLSTGEAIYDYELESKGCILPFSVIFETEIDLFSKKELIEKSITSWKKLHPFLCTKIVTLEDEKHRFSRERYFAYADNETKINKLDNVFYLRLLTSNKTKNRTNYWKLLHERELNLEPVDCKNGLLWRLNFVELNSPPQSNKFEYSIILTIHHGITDGINCYYILKQLLGILENLILDKDDETESKTFDINPSIDDFLFKNQDEASIIKSIKLDPKYEISEFNKIPSNFSFQQNQNSIANELIGIDDIINDSDKFVYAFNEYNNQEILIKDLLDKRNKNQLVSKFTSFSFEQDVCKKLLHKCKSVNAKLTGCLNLICSLATFELYNKYNNHDLNKEICYHFLANLRPFLNVGNLNMGYFAVVFNGLFKTSNLNESNYGSDEFWSKQFWDLVKLESDDLHKRVESSELNENAKLDFLLLDLIEKNNEFYHGSVHFALSNLGAMKSELELFDFKEFYYNTSSVKNRWTAIVFHGLSSVNDKLCWSLGYNSDLFDDLVIQTFIENVKHIVQTVIN